MFLWITSIGSICTPILYLVLTRRDIYTHLIESICTLFYSLYSYYFSLMMESSMLYFILTNGETALVLLFYPHYGEACTVSIYFIICLGDLCTCELISELIQSNWRPLYLSIANLYVSILDLNSVLILLGQLLYLYSDWENAARILLGQSNLFIITDGGILLLFYEFTAVLYFCSRQGRLVFILLSQLPYSIYHGGGCIRWVLIWAVVLVTRTFILSSGNGTVVVLSFGRLSILYDAVLANLLLFTVYLKNNNHNNRDRIFLAKRKSYPLAEWRRCSRGNFIYPTPC